MATTMAELLKKLSDCEMARLAADKEARLVILAAEHEVTNACFDLQELRRAQEQEVKVLKAQLEKKTRDNAYYWRQEVNKARQGLAELVAQLDSTEQRRRRAEAHEKHLAAKVADLQAQLDRRTQDAEASMLSVGQMMDARVQQVTRQGETRVRAMSVHAKEVCDAAQSAIEVAAEELQDQSNRSLLRAEGRVRFKELCELSKLCNNYEMSKDAYFGMKDDLIALWQSQRRHLKSPGGKGRSQSPLDDLTAEISAVSQMAAGGDCNLLASTLAKTGRVPQYEALPGSTSPSPKPLGNTMSTTAPSPKSDWSGGSPTLLPSLDNRPFR